MEIKKIILFLLLFSLFLNSCSSKENNSVMISNSEGSKEVKVEIADSLEERALGLMFREFLDDDEGMLFIFEDEDYLSFWMKNTLIPLDMIFISEDFEIVDIKQAVPCREDPCISYKTLEPAKYVLEVNGNFTIKNNIKIGNKILFNFNREHSIK
jgi:uncharacterized protein